MSITNGEDDDGLRIDRIYFGVDILFYLDSSDFYEGMTVAARITMGTQVPYECVE